MKFLTVLIYVFVGLISTTQAQTLPSQIPDWMQNIHAELDTIDIGHPIQETFYDQEVAQILKDSFLINNANMILKIQALSLEREQIDYGYDVPDVSVGYGMMPGCGNYWSKVSFGRFSDIAKKYVVEKLTKNRTNQTKLYNWSRPTIVSSFSQKPVIAQALDMFAVWKSNEYLASYDLDAEVKRSKVKEDNFSTFTSTDWLGRYDPDAKIYAFWHRRIKSHHDTGQGFSLHDAQYWSTIALDDMKINAKLEATMLTIQWVEKWQDGNFTTPDTCELDPSLCE